MNLKDIKPVIVLRNLWIILLILSPIIVYGWQDFSFDAGQSISVNGTTGNVGVGSPSPSSKLDVQGTVRATGFSGNGSLLTNIPNAGISGLATVATTGSYTDLINKPSVDQVYDGTTLRSNAVWYVSSATVTSGIAVFQLTTDGTSTGTSVFPNGVLLKSVSPTPNDATAVFGYSWLFSNSNKTLTVTVNKSSPTGVIALLGINILGSPVAAANGTVVNISVVGY